MNNMNEINTPDKNLKHNDPFSRIFAEIRTWWNGLLKPEKETPVEKILESSRNRLMAYGASALLCMFLILWDEFTYKNIAWAAEILSVYAFLNEWYFLSAARTSREERLEFQRNEGKRSRRFIFLIFFIVAFSIIITQNVLGIGDAITSALPWTKPAAETVLGFINGIVEEYTDYFSK